MNDTEPKEPKESKTIEQLIETETNELISTFANLRERFKVSNQTSYHEIKTWLMMLSKIMGNG